MPCHLGCYIFLLVLATVYGTWVSPESDYFEYDGEDYPYYNDDYYNPDPYYMTEEEYQAREQFYKNLEKYFKDESDYAVDTLEKLYEKNARNIQKLEDTLNEIEELEAHARGVSSFEQWMDHLDLRNKLLEISMEYDTGRSLYQIVRQFEHNGIGEEIYDFVSRKLSKTLKRMKQRWKDFFLWNKQESEFLQKLMLGDNETFQSELCGENQDYSECLIYWRNPEDICDYEQDPPLCYPFSKSAIQNNCDGDYCQLDPPKFLENLDQRLAQTTEIKVICVDSLLKITSYILSAETINQYAVSSDCDYSTILVISGSEIFLNQDLTFPGKNLVIFAPKWKMSSNSSINLSPDFEDMPNGGNFRGYGIEFERLGDIRLESTVGTSNVTDVVREEGGKGCTYNETELAELFSGSLGGEMRLFKRFQEFHLQPNNDEGNLVEAIDDENLKIYCSPSEYVLLNLEEQETKAYEFRIDKATIKSFLFQDYIEAMVDLDIPLEQPVFDLYTTSVVSNVEDFIEKFWAFENVTVGKGDSDNYIPAVKALLAELEDLQRLVDLKDLKIEEKIILNYINAILLTRMKKAPEGVLYLNIEEFLENSWSDMRQIKTGDEIKLMNVKESPYRDEATPYERFYLNEMEPTYAEAYWTIHDEVQTTMKALQQLRPRKGDREAFQYLVSQIESLLISQMMLEELMNNPVLTVLERKKRTNENVLRAYQSANFITFQKSKGLIVEDLNDMESHHTKKWESYLKRYVGMCEEIVNFKLSRESYLTMLLMKGIRRISCYQTNTQHCKEIDKVIEIIKKTDQKCWRNKMYTPCEKYYQTYFGTMSTIDRIMQDVIKSTKKQHKTNDNPMLINVKPSSWHKVVKCRAFYQYLLQYDDLFKVDQFVDMSVSFSKKCETLTEIMETANKHSTYFMMSLGHYKDRIPVHKLRDSILENLEQVVKPVVKMLRSTMKNDMVAAIMFPVVDATLKGIEKIKNLLNGEAYYQKMLDRYLANVNVNKPYEDKVPEEYRGLVDTCDETIRNELVSLKMEESISALSMYVFPFANEFQQYWHIPKRVEPEMPPAYEIAVLQMLKLKQSFYTLNSPVDEYVKLQHFNPDVCSCPPFYSWSNENINADSQNLTQFLEGSGTLSLKADIFDTESKQNALRGRGFRIRFYPKTKKHERKLRKHLKKITHSTVELVHRGEGYIRYDNRVYKMQSEEMTLYFSLSPNHIEYNELHRKFMKNDFWLTPYANWMITIKHNEEKDKERLLRAAKYIGGIQLIGEGWYVQEYIYNLQMDRFYKPLNEL